MVYYSITFQHSEPFMSFLPPSNPQRTLMSSVPSTQLELAESNLTATINRISNAFAIPLSPSVTPYWLLTQVNEFSESLDSYVIAGGDPYKQLWSLHFCKVLSDATVEVLRGDYHRKPFVDEDYIIQIMKEVVMDVAAITETLGHSAFGDNLECSWHGFIVKRACESLFGEH